MRNPFTSMLLLAVLVGCGDDGEPPITLVDAGASDAGASDAGAVDAGAVDAGAADAGAADAGPPVDVRVTRTGSLNVVRLGHTATRVSDGRVIVIGGENLAREPTASIEAYDPATGDFEEVASLATARANHTATLLADGRILVVGGGRSASNGLPSGADVLESVEIFDPTTNEVTAGPALMSARSHHGAFGLEDGSVLVVAGATPRSEGAGFTPLATAERLDPDLTAWAPAGRLTAARAMVRLASDGRGGAWVIGGSLGGPGSPAVDRFDASSGSFTDSGSLAGPGRFFHDVIRTREGDVIVVGGIASTFVSAVDVLPAGETTFVRAPDLSSPRNTVALVETDAGVLGVGGYFYSGSSEPLEEILHYDASTRSFAAVGALPVGRAGHTATVLESGDVLVLGGYGRFGESADVFLIHVE